MRISYISCLMFTLITFASAADKAAMDQVNAKIIATMQQIQALKKNLLIMNNPIDVPFHEASTRIVGFESSYQATHPVIHNGTKPDISTPHEPRIPLTDCYLSDRLPTRGRSATILETLQEVNACQNRGTAPLCPAVPLCCTYTAYAIVDRNALEENQKANAKFQRIEGFNLQAKP